MLRFKSGECTVSVSVSFFALITFVLIIADSEIALISLFSSFLHESGHIVAMLVLGDKIRRLSFTATGIRLDKTREKSVSYNSEIIISLAGVGINFALSVLFFSLYNYVKNLMFRNIAIVNMLVGIFNLLPVENLDGARALYYALLKRINQEKADKIIVYISSITVVCMIIASIFITFYGGTNFSLIIVIIYLLILLINHIIELKK